MSEYRSRGRVDIDILTSNVLTARNRTSESNVECLSVPNFISHSQAKARRRLIANAPGKEPRALGWQ
eukprot:763385-Hanusia_phi.AAC.6